MLPTHRVLKSPTRHFDGLRGISKLVATCADACDSRQHLMHAGGPARQGMSLGGCDGRSRAVDGKVQSGTVTRS